MIYKGKKIYLNTIKYMIVFFSAFFIGFWIYLILSPNAEINFNNEIQDVTFLNSLPFLIVGLILLIPFLIIGNKVVELEMEGEIIRIKKKNEIKEYYWKDVESINLSTFIIPLTYRISMKGEKGYYLFGTGYDGFAIPLFKSWDFTEFGKFIKKQKTKYKII